jgi:hypothetical protein
LDNASFPFSASTLLSESVLQDHRVNDISAGNASPSKKIFNPTVKILISHKTTASIAFHGDPPYVFISSTILAYYKVPVVSG